jgi:uncharacterized protein DUF6448
VKTRNRESNSRWKLPVSIDPATNPDAQELVDLYVFETVVRIHRDGESESYTGLKSAGPDLGPVIPAADKAIENGSVGPLMKLVTDASEAVSENSFKRYLLQNASTEKDLRAGT